MTTSHIEYRGCLLCHPERSGVEGSKAHALVGDMPKILRQAQNDIGLEYFSSGRVLIV